MLARLALAIAVSTSIFSLLNATLFLPVIGIESKDAIDASYARYLEGRDQLTAADTKGYLDLVASKAGWANVPPGTRTSLYNNPEYQKAAPFAKMTLDSINAADPTKPSAMASSTTLFKFS